MPSDSIPSSEKRGINEGTFGKIIGLMIAVAGILTKIGYDFVTGLLAMVAILLFFLILHDFLHDFAKQISRER